MELSATTLAVLACLLLSFGAHTSASASQPDASIRNEAVSVVYSGNAFRLTAAKSAKPFAVCAPSGGEGVAAVVAVTNPTFGRGKAIVLSHSDGTRETVSLYPKLPFALFERTLKGSSDNPISWLKKIPNVPIAPATAAKEVYRNRST